LYYIIYCFEILNMIVQLFIFTLLCIEYIISSDLLVIFL
jgi:F0F1-type ATP synthase membrane subunit a